ncbi:hypothetical protein ATH84_10196 [Paracoccus versutus]|uniref:Uncharacterized protein n=1 Tax=Paracoccus versutus TaxID=34007 RepID=A0AAQ0HII8_PARVE|nr:hypothetical protein [Paracoccus versutus]KGJ11108.1 hypothetical protein IT40_08960 [Paracoccus versutus]REG45738.1 hypothetical protein ATH84_10196 [Paracoccus versutus]
MADAERILRDAWLRLPGRIWGGHASTISAPRRADAMRGTCRLPEPLVQDALAGVEQQDVGIALTLTLHGRPMQV